MRKPLSVVSVRLSALIALVVILGAPRSAPACGVWTIDNNYLGAGQEDMILSLPKWDFETVLRQMAAVPARSSSNWVRRGSRESESETQIAKEVADLDVALREAATPDERRAQILESFRAYRIGVLGKTPPLPGTARGAAPVDLVLLSDELRAALPPEFALYLQGAEAFRRSGPLASPDPANPALAAWQRLLDLPAAERRHRSVWAAFMMGKALLPAKRTDSLTTESAVAIDSAFDMTRALAAEGFPDPLGLAAESLGWQARAELMSGETTAAIDHYYDMFRLGTEDQRNVAVLSIWQVLRDKFPREQEESSSTDSEEMAYFASDPLARDIATIWMASEKRGWAGWPQAVRDAGDPVSPLVAPHLAVIAYEHGDFSSARAFAQAAESTSTLAQWVLAKTLLYEGKVGQGRALLKEIAPRAQSEYGDSGVFGSYQSYDWYAGIAEGEYGVLLLAKEDFAGALEGFLRGQDWADAAYVAERVLSVRELADFLRRNEKADFLTAPMDSSSAQPPPEECCGGRLRWLLGRRLMRSGKTREALPYLPEKWRAEAERYGNLLVAARDEDRPRRERALDYFAAAWIARYAGIETMGTEMEPDWLESGGSFLGREGASVLRGLGGRSSSMYAYERAPLPNGLRHFSSALGQALRPTQDELDRVADSAPSPNVRFHYRFVAADLGWKAARLLPDNDPALAYILWLSGSWIKDRDDRYADKFYQALVGRCRKLPISDEADRLRWFPHEAPPMPDEIAPLVDLQLQKDASKD